MRGVRSSRIGVANGCGVANASASDRCDSRTWPKPAITGTAARKTKLEPRARRADIKYRDVAAMRKDSAVIAVWKSRDVDATVFCCDETSRNQKSAQTPTGLSALM